MKTRWLLALSLLFVASTAALPAAAQAEGLSLREESAEGELLNPEDKMSLVSENVELKSSSGTVKCPKTEGEASLLWNGGSESVAEVTKVNFEAGGKCTFGSLSATVTAKNLPWRAEFLESEKALVTGSPVALEVKVFAFGIPVAECLYSASSFTGGFELGKSLGLSITEQGFIVSGTGECPSSGTLSANVTVTKGGKAVVPTQGAKVVLREKDNKGAALAKTAAVVGSYSNFKFNQVDTKNLIECTTNEFKGEVAENGDKDKNAVIQTTSFEFNGGKKGDKCNTNYIFDGAFGKAVITPESTWKIFFSPSPVGSFRINDLKFKEEIYDSKGTLQRTCFYSEAIVGGDFKFGSPLGLTFKREVSLVTTGSSANCSKKVKMEGTFTVKTSPGDQAVVPFRE